MPRPTGGKCAAERPHRNLSLVTIHLSLRRGILPRHGGCWVEECLTQSPQSEREGCEREELTRSRRDAEGLEGEDFAQKNKKETKGRQERGRKVNIENHENRFADMEKREGEAAAPSGRGRPARGASGKRKTSEKTNVFYNLA